MMPSLEQRPLYTRTLSGWEQLSLNQNSAYLWGSSFEPRSNHPTDWQDRESGARFVKIVSQNSTAFSAEGAIEAVVQLRSAAQMKEFIEQVGDDLYLNITGLPLHVWAPILKYGNELSVNVHVVYAEPLGYIPSGASADSLIFDLSERTAGISTLPGFAHLIEPDDPEDFYFVPILGFEGARLAFMLNQFEIPHNRILPVVGAPGFRPEYPFHAYLGNRVPFEDSPIWQGVRFGNGELPI